MGLLTREFPIGKELVRDKSAADESFELADVRPMWRIVASQFFEHRMAVVGLFVIIFFVLVALSAPLISRVTGIDPNAQDVFNRYKGPFTKTLISEADREGRIEKLVGAEGDLVNTLGQELIANGSVTNATDANDAVYSLLDLNLVDARTKIAALKSAGAVNLDKVFAQFETLHVLGTDELGRDVLMRLIFGTRVSISVGLLVAFAAAFIGLLIGALAGFYGGVVDTILGRVIDSLLALPLLPLMIVLAAVDLKKVPIFGAMISGENESITKLIVILVLFSWMRAARLVRGSILSVREREFVLAARTLGARNFGIIFGHIVPNVIAPLLVAVTLNIGEAVVSEATLSFLGLGIQPPTPSWGNILFNAQEIIYQSPVLVFAPGLLIFLTVISFNFVGDGLQDAIDPKAIRR